MLEPHQYIQEWPEEKYQKRVASRLLIMHFAFSSLFPYLPLVLGVLKPTVTKNDLHRHCEGRDLETTDCVVEVGFPANLRLLLNPSQKELSSVILAAATQQYVVVFPVCQ